MTGVPEPPILPIHGSGGYALQSLGGGHDVVDGAWSSDWTVLLAKVGESYVPLRKFSSAGDAVDYVETQLRAARARREERN
jgi:hypothetical protein